MNETTLGMGSLKNPEDYRDIPASLVLQPQPVLPEASEAEDFELLPVENQGPKPACTGYDKAKRTQYSIFRSTGDIVKLSPRFYYGAAKEIDGIPDVAGTYPRCVDYVANRIGCALTDTVPDDTTLPDADYVSFGRTPDIALEAQIYRTPGTTYIRNDATEILKSISQFHVIGFSILVDSSSFWLTDDTPLVVSRSGKPHRLPIYRYLKQPDGKHRVWFRNSWGPQWGRNGLGSFILEDQLAAGTAFDFSAEAQIPAYLIAEAKRLPRQPTYAFAKALSFGMSNDRDVMALQDCLKSLGYMSIAVPSTGNYGPTTAQAVLDFQTFFRAATWLELKLLGGRRVGPSTLALLNSLFNKKMENSRIDDWCAAQQEREGWYAGSRSFRNNNPGNLEFEHQPGAVMETGHAPNRFAHFDTYAHGYAALRNLLVNAATGHSSSYSPEMTLEDFYNVYSPKGDGDNNPNEAAAFVAGKMKVPVTTKIKTLV